MVYCLGLQQPGDLLYGHSTHVERILKAIYPYGRYYYPDTPNPSVWWLSFRYRVSG